MEMQIDETNNLEKLRLFIEDLNSTNSTLEKSAKLKTYVGDEFIRDVLLYTYDPYRKYNVTVAALEKNDGMLDKSRSYSLFGLLDALNAREITGHTAIGRVNAYVTGNFLYTKQIYAILDRNLKIRLDVNEINKVFFDLIPTFDVALAKAFEWKMTVANKKGEKKVNFNEQVWIGSRKLDGVRCICTIDENGSVSFKSREGHEFYTLEVLRKEVQSWGLRSIVFDGEVCMMDKAGNEDFQGVMKQIRKKDHTISNPRYNVFDMIPLKHFTNKIGDTILSDRHLMLSKTVSEMEAKGLNVAKLITVLSQGRITSDDHLRALSEIASKNGWEGLIIRKDVVYAGTRSSDMLKVKDMQDAEYVITGVVSDMITATYYRDGISMREVEFNDGEYFYKDDFTKVPSDDIVEAFADTRMMVSRLMIEHKGNPVGVGSGLSQFQRRSWHVDNSLIIGKTVTIQYFQETEVDGRMSLRFPVLKHVFENGRDV